MMNSENQSTSKPPKKRLPQLSRASKDDLFGFRLTERDHAILQAVYEYRALTGEQIEALFFSRSARTQRNNRLKGLYHHGFLGRTEQPQSLTEGRKPFVYWLDMKGAELLALEYGCDVTELDWNPRGHVVKPLFLDHLLATNDIRIAVSRAAAQQGFVIEEWRDDKTLHKEHAQDKVAIKNSQGKVEYTSIIPDGYFVLKTGTARYRFFVEADRRTVTGEATTLGTRDWSRKVLAYLAFFRSNIPETRYGSRRFRVLTVTTGAKRLANLRAVTEKMGGQRKFWFTTFASATAEQILTEAVWEVATGDTPRSLIDRDSSISAGS